MITLVRKKIGDGGWGVSQGSSRDSSFKGGQILGSLARQLDRRREVVRAEDSQRLQSVGKAAKVVSCSWCSRGTGISVDWWWRFYGLYTLRSIIRLWWETRMVWNHPRV